MGETFYTVLGVTEDADAETIRSAYRAMVKEHHPDVSDDPGASERFKRLTTAKDVLVDEDERERYDRLGHDRYVTQHVESPVWTDGTASSSSSVTSTSSSATGGASERESGTRQTATRGPDRTTWLGEDVSTAGNSAGRGHPRAESQRARRHTGPGTADGRGWQYASGVYRGGETEVEPTKSRLRSVASGLRAVGPWLAIHFVFILSAVATGWFTYTQAERTIGLSVPSMTLGILVVGFVVFLSLVHIVTRVYA